MLNAILRGLAFIVVVAVMFSADIVGGLLGSIVLGVLIEV